MCTAVSYKGYFGRNLDLERSYGECVIITPRNAEITMRHTRSLKTHYALIGMAALMENVPLYFEATNEKGLSMAGLNFPGNADYKPLDANKDNVAPFELIPWILGQCSTIEEVKKLLECINVVDTCFSPHVPLSPLHWMISDKDRSITVESVKDGLRVYDNPWSVLTNNPTFDYHLLNMHPYMSLYEGGSQNTLNQNIQLDNYSLGFGALGLPGDFTSTSRFVRACYVKSKSICTEEDKDCVNQFFHILNSVAMPKGCVLCPNGEFEYTRYSCCCSQQGVYTYTTYENSTKISVDMHSVDLNASTISLFPLVQ